MAKRKRGKGKRKRSRGKRRSKRSSPKATHSAAIEAGLGVSLFKMATDKATTGASPIDALKSGNPLTVKVTDAATRAAANALAWDNSKWVLYGMGLHWAKNKPIAKIILKPADKLVKLVAGRRYGV